LILNLGDEQKTSGATVLSDSKQKMDLAAAQNAAPNKEIASTRVGAQKITSGHAK